MSEIHFADWSPGVHMHTHIGRCIKCGGSEGVIIIYVRLTRQGGKLALQLDGISNSLCPQCRAKYQPLTHAMRQELNRLSGKLWHDLHKRGCPCCQAGLNWQPAVQVH